MKEEQISIAIVDDHTLFRSGVAALMNEFDRLKVVFEAGNGVEMQERLRHKPLPQVILMDINMPVMDGYDATRWLKGNYPQIKVLALSMFDDEKAVINMIQCGAVGYVLKESKPTELLEAITAIYTNGIYINDLMSGNLIRSVITKESGLEITARELEFIRLCCTELTYKEIAEVLFLSPRTVDNYRESLFQKLNLKSRTGLVLYAIQNELIKL